MTKAKNGKGKGRKPKPQGQIGNVDGQGGYYSDKIVPFMSKVIPKGTFGRAGNFLGGGVASAINPAFIPAGALAGRAIGQKIASIMGFGAYTVKENSLLKSGGVIPEGMEVPQFDVKTHATRVRHREYIRDIVVPSSPTVFTNLSFTINPGDIDTFPWLSPIASRFQQYRFNGIVFEFKTLSSDITAGGALGAVILATNYDVTADLFKTKLAMENTEYTVSAKPSITQMHCVECDPSLTQSKLLYVRDNAYPNTDTRDSRLFDLGNFQLATVGLPGSAGAVLGELWVTYDVNLYKPDLSSPLTYQTAKLIANGGISKTVPLGTTPLITGGFIIGTINTIQFNSGFTGTMDFAVNGTVLVLPTISFSGGGSGAQVTQNGYGSGAAISNWKITMPERSSVTFDFTASTTVTAFTAWCTGTGDSTNLV